MKKPGAFAVAFARLALRALDAPKLLIAIVLLPVVLTIVLGVAWRYRSRRGPDYPCHSLGAVGAGRFATVVRSSEVASYPVVFERGAKTWIAHRVFAPGPSVPFGSLALSEKSFAVASAFQVPGAACDERRQCPHSEEIRIFRREDSCSPESGNCWHYDTSLIDPQPVVIRSALAADGDTLVSLSPLFDGDRSRELRIYHRFELGWTIEHRQQTKAWLELALHGDRLLVPMETPTLFHRESGKWSVIATLLIPGQSKENAFSVALSTNHALVSFGRRGVHLFSRDAQGSWSWETELIAESLPKGTDPNDENFDWGTGLAFEGERALVSFSQLGNDNYGISAVIFDRVDGHWRQVDLIHYADPSIGIGMYSPFAASEGLVFMGLSGPAVLSKDPNTQRFGRPQVPGQGFPM